MGRSREQVCPTSEQQVGKSKYPHQAPIVLSMPGFGGVLAAELLAAIGDISRFPTAGRLAVASGMAPVSRDSGSNTGNRLRPTQCSRPLQRAFFLSSQVACMTAGDVGERDVPPQVQGLHT